MEQLGKGWLAIIGAVLALAILAVFVGKNSPAPAVIKQAGSALAGLISSAVTLNVTAGAQTASQQALQTVGIQTPTALLPGLLGS